MEPKNTGKSWRTLVSSISDDYPAWFYVQLQDIMKYVYFELEGIDLEHQEENESEFFGFDDYFDWVTDRPQLTRDLEVAINIFAGMPEFRQMNPAECAKLVISKR